MKKMFLLVFVCLSLFAYGLDVDVEELSATKDTSVEFVNYEGPHSKIETIEQIKGIGRHLGRQVTDSFGDFTYAGKYRVIHAVDPADSKGMDADIFLILPAAQVDHIINIRRIISGFLEAAYQYSAVDADLLAEFITVYNAVFRGRMDYFNERYKQIVIRNLDAESVGISTVYTQWPGKTRMVIPLTGAAADGGIGSLDSDMLTEKEVIEKLQTEDDKGLDIRKDMTELKEREVEVEQERIDADKEALEDEQQRIAAEQQRLQEEKERIAKEKAEAEDEEAQRALAEREAALKAEEEKLRREEEDAAEKSQELNEREEDQAERVERIQQEREEIAEDARELIGQDVEGQFSRLHQDRYAELQSQAPEQVLNKPVSALELSVRCRKAIQLLNIQTVGDLAVRTEAELMGIKNFGATSLQEIKERLAEHGLELRDLA